MSVTRINYFTAKDGTTEQVYSLLQTATSMIKTAPGYLSVRLLHSQENPNDMVIIEEWDSVEAHQAAAGNIPPEMLGRIIPLLAVPPKGTYYSME